MKERIKIIVLSSATILMMAFCVWVGYLPTKPVVSDSHIGIYAPGNICTWGGIQFKGITKGFTYHLDCKTVQIWNN